jgi:hypothetical protein
MCLYFKYLLFSPLLNTHETEGTHRNQNLIMLPWLRLVTLVTPIEIENFLSMSEFFRNSIEPGLQDRSIHLRKGLDFN